jgi:hypothetical protein
MLRFGHRRATGVIALAVAAALVAVPAVASASTNALIAQTGGMTATLPILGGGVSVTVALDPVGNITGVTVAGGTPTLSQTKASPAFVKFATADGQTKVTVKAMGSKLAISARVTSLAELVGTGTWSADVFGTKSPSTASYTIGDNGSGTPTVALATPTGGPGTWAALPPKSSTDNDGAMASAGGTFTYQGFTKTLRITVKVDKAEGDDPGSASLSITLTGRDVQLLTGTLAALSGAGNRTWSAYLCDAKTQVTVTYKVNVDGSIGFVSATPATPTTTQKSVDKGLVVRFNGTSVGVWIMLKDNKDGTFTLQVRGSSGRCGNGKGDGGHNGFGAPIPLLGQSGDSSGGSGGGQDGGGH